MREASSLTARVNFKCRPIGLCDELAERTRHCGIRDGHVHTGSPQSEKGEHSQPAGSVRAMRHSPGRTPRTDDQFVGLLPIHARSGVREVLRHDPASRPCFLSVGVCISCNADVYFMVSRSQLTRAETGVTISPHVSTRAAMRLFVACCSDTIFLRDRFSRDALFAIAALAVIYSAPLLRLTYRRAHSRRRRRMRTAIPVIFRR